MKASLFVGALGFFVISSSAQAMGLTDLVLETALQTVRQDLALSGSVKCTNFAGKWSGKCVNSAGKEIKSSFQLVQLGCGSLISEGGILTVGEATTASAHLKMDPNDPSIAQMGWIASADWDSGYEVLTASVAGQVRATKLPVQSFTGTQTYSIQGGQLKTEANYLGKTTSCVFDKE